MKFQTLPVKRRPVTKGIFRRLSAVTRNRRQRAAAAPAAPASEFDEEDGGSKISRALTIIFLIHIVAIGLIFFHQRFLDGRAPEETAAAPKLQTAAEAALAALPAPAPREDLPQLSSGEKPYIVRAGDNYTRIAAAQGVDEGELRLLNKHVDIRPGLILKIPARRIVAEEPPEVAAIRAQTPSDQDSGLVEAVDVSNAPKARLVRPAGDAPGAFRAIEKSTAPAASGKSHTVKPGENIWRIANKYKVGQDALMQANNITDARKLRAGMNLVIPASN